MILCFHDGPMDGLEEPHHGAGEPPFLLMRMPSLGEMVRASETANPSEEPVAFGATYRLERVEDGVAHYQVRAI